MALLEEAARRRIPLGVTGIGYDGEERDTVTLLPKPRIRVPVGALVTTSESCLSITDARWTDLRRTGFRTALGDVVVVRVTSPGLFVVAGPNKTHELEQVRQALDGEALDLLMVDGSLNRIAPMSVVDRLVVSTGAARSTDPAVVSSEMRAIESLFMIPRLEQRLEREVERWPVISAGMPATEAIALATTQQGSVRWQGLVSLEVFTQLGAAAGLHQRVLVFDDPLKLLLAGDIRQVASAVHSVRQMGWCLACIRVPRLVAVTSNPFYPAFDGSVYSGGAIDGVELQKAIGVGLRTPVIDVVRDGGHSLFAAVCST